MDIHALVRLDNHKISNKLPFIAFFNPFEVIDPKRYTENQIFFHTFWSRHGFFLHFFYILNQYEFTYASTIRGLKKCTPMGRFWNSHVQ